MQWILKWEGKIKGENKLEKAEKEFVVKKRHRRGYLNTIPSGSFGLKCIEGLVELKGPALRDMEGSKLRFSNI